MVLPHLTPSLPLAPQSTPLTSSSSRLPRAPIYNPYDKFTQPQFDDWIGGLTGALKRALGHEEATHETVTQPGATTDDGVDYGAASEEEQEEYVEDSFADLKARRAKGKSRDPREGPGLGGDRLQPIEIQSDSDDDTSEDSDDGDNTSRGSREYGSSREDDMFYYDEGNSEGSGEGSDAEAAREGSNSLAEVIDVLSDDDQVLDGEEEDEYGEEYEDDMGEDGDGDADEIRGSSRSPNGRYIVGMAKLGHPVSNGRLVERADDEEGIDELSQLSDDIWNEGGQPDGVESTAPELPDVWAPAETYAQDFYANGDVPADATDPHTIALTPEEQSAGTSLTPGIATPADDSEQQLTPDLADVWSGPHTYAEDFYNDGNISLGASDPHALGRAVEATLVEASSWPPDLLPSTSREAPPFELPDVWNGPQTYAEDYYADGDVSKGAEDPHDIVPSRSPPAPQPATIDVDEEDGAEEAYNTRQLDNELTTRVAEEEAKRNESSPDFAIFDPPALSPSKDNTSHGVHPADYADSGLEEDLYADLPQDSTYNSTQNNETDESEAREEPSLQRSRPPSPEPQPVSTEGGLNAQERRDKPVTAPNGHINWNRPPAFPVGIPATAAGRLASPPAGDGIAEEVTADEVTAEEVIAEEVTVDEVTADVASQYHLSRQTTPQGNSLAIPMPIFANPNVHDPTSLAATPESPRSRAATPPAQQPTDDSAPAPVSPRAFDEGTASVSPALLKALATQDQAVISSSSGLFTPQTTANSASPSNASDAGINETSDDRQNDVPSRELSAGVPSPTDAASIPLVDQQGEDVPEQRQEDDNAESEPLDEDVVPTGSGGDISVVSDTRPSDATPTPVEPRLEENDREPTPEKHSPSDQETEVLPEPNYDDANDFPADGQTPAFDGEGAASSQPTVLEASEPGEVSALNDEPRSPFNADDTLLLNGDRDSLVDPPADADAEGEPDADGVDDAAGDASPENEAVAAADEVTGNASTVAPGAEGEPDADSVDDVAGDASPENKAVAAADEVTVTPGAIEPSVTYESSQRGQVDDSLAPDNGDVFASADQTRQPSSEPQSRAASPEAELDTATSSLTVTKTSKRNQLKRKRNAPVTAPTLSTRSMVKKGKEKAVDNDPERGSQRSIDEDNKSETGTSSSGASVASRMLTIQSRTSSRASSEVSNATSDNSSRLLPSSPSKNRPNPPPLMHTHSNIHHHHHHHHRAPPPPVVQIRRRTVSSSSTRSSLSKELTPEASASQAGPSQPASQPAATSFSSPVTRSNCRFHKISLPREENGPRIYFVVPGCSLSNRELMKSEEIEDHGYATLDEHQQTIDDIESLDFSSYLVGILRQLVGVDLLREHEVFYLPQPGDNYRRKRRRKTAAETLSQARLASRETAGRADSRSTTGSPRHGLLSSPSSSISRAPFSAASAASASTAGSMRGGRTQESISAFAPSDDEVSGAESEQGPRPKRRKKAPIKNEADDHGSVKEGSSTKEPEASTSTRTLRTRRSKRLSMDAAAYKPDHDPTEDSTEEDLQGNKRRKKAGKRGVKRTRTSEVGAGPVKVDDGGERKIKRPKIRAMGRIDNDVNDEKS